MKTYITALLLVSAFINVSGQTFIGGGIFVNTIFTLQNSPYIVTDNVVLFQNLTLDIEPGVEIKFDGNYYFEIRGTITAIGNGSNRIVFTSNLATPSKGDWDGIRIMNNLGAMASFEYCDFQYASTSNSSQCCWGGGPIYYDNCRFLDNTSAFSGYTGYDIYIDNCEFSNNTVCIPSADKVVNNSTFTNNDYGLSGTERIDVFNSTFSNNNIAIYGGRGVLDGCLIDNNNIGVKSYFEGFTIENCDIIDNDVGIQLPNTAYQPSIRSNNICNNLTFNVENTGPQSKDLTDENCWCSVDETVIASKIWDGYDDVSLGIISYDVYNSIWCLVPCDGDSLYLNPIVLDQYNANTYLSTDAIIGPNQNILLNSGNSLEFLPNFEIQQGSSLETNIWPCSN